MIARRRRDPPSNKTYTLQLPVHGPKPHAETPRALSLLSFQMASSSFPVKFCAHIHKNLGFQAMSEFAGRLSSRRR